MSRGLQPRRCRNFMPEKYRICWDGNFGFCTSRSIFGRVCCCSRPRSRLSRRSFFRSGKCIWSRRNTPTVSISTSYSYKIQGGGLNGQHLVEINNLNHYIGMKPIQAGRFHRDALDAVRVRSDHFDDAALGRVRRNEQRRRSVRRLLYFGVFSIGSFWYRLYQYGHNLDPHAPMHIKPFTPLLIGVEQIANFREYSFPQAGRVSALSFGVAHCAGRLVFAERSSA